MVIQCVVCSHMTKRQHTTRQQVSFPKIQMSDGNLARPLEIKREMKTKQKG